MKLLACLLALPMLAGAAFAQVPGDADAPITIEADQLEVLQADSKAIFSGNVLAVQGDIKLRADTMTVFYKGGETAGGGSGIDRIEVAGNVVIATPEETAQGDKGRFDAANRKLFLEQNVVLTRGENVLKGGALEYDLNTKKSKLTSGGSGRVQGLFVPEGGK